MPIIPRVKFFWAFNHYHHVMYNSEKYPNESGYNEFKKLTSAIVPQMTTMQRPSEHVVTVSDEGAKLIELCLNRSNAYALIKAWLVRHATS